MGKSIIYENLPSLGTPWGLLFYTMFGYMIIKFLMFMIRGDTEEIVEESKQELKSKIVREKGLGKREENKHTPATYKPKGPPPKTVKETLESDAPKKYD